MKKLTTIFLSFISIFLLVSMVDIKVVSALSCKVGLQSQQFTYAKGDEISITVSISNLQAGNGVVALGAVLDYDKTSLELKEVKGENAWSAQIGKNQTKIIAYSGKKVTKDEDVIKLTFAVKKDTTAKSTWVKVSNFEISDGNEESTANAVTLTLSIREKETQSSQGGNSGSGNSSEVVTPSPDIKEEEPIATEKPVETKDPSDGKTEEEKDPTESTTKQESVNQTENHTWTLFVPLGIIIIIIIAILVYVKRKKK